MRTRAVTITLRLVVPDSPELDAAVEPRTTMLGDLLHTVGGVLLEETVAVLREELGDTVEAISHRHTIEAPTDDSEEW